MHISIKPETIYQIAGFPVTNSILLTWIILGLFSLFAFFFQREFRKNNKSLFIIGFFSVLKGMYTLLESVMKDKITLFFPLLASFFFFIILSNWFGLFPGVGSILVPEVHKADKVTKETTHVSKEVQKDTRTVAEQRDTHADEKSKAVEKAHEDTKDVHKVPLLRSPSADVNTTFALGFITYLAMQVFGLGFLKMEYVKRFLSPLGILEFVSDLSKILSFGFRLFGNIFAGEVLLLVLTFLVPVFLSGFATFPFFMLELFVGFMQALIFTMLSSVLILTALTSHHKEEAHH